MKFQFHKVRLKGYRKAIELLKDVFQFHKVRLKGLHTRKNTTDGLKFQFHKVRLKERQ